MKKITLSLAAVVLLALGTWTLTGAAPESPVVPADLVAPAPASPTLDLDADCGQTPPSLLPEGVEAGPQQACCLDECRTDADCFFRCGGEPGVCTMPNPCCTVCECVVSSFSIAS